MQRLRMAMEGRGRSWKVMEGHGRGGWMGRSPTWRRRVIMAEVRPVALGSRPIRSTFIHSTRESQRRVYPGGDVGRCGVDMWGDVGRYGQNTHLHPQHRRRHLRTTEARRVEGVGHALWVVEAHLTRVSPTRQGEVRARHEAPREVSSGHRGSRYERRDRETRPPTSEHRRAVPRPPTPERSR